MYLSYSNLWTISSVDVDVDKGVLALCQQSVIEYVYNIFHSINGTNLIYFWTFGLSFYIFKCKKGIFHVSALHFGFIKGFRKPESSWLAPRHLA